RASIKAMPPCGSTAGSAMVDALSPMAGAGRSRPIIPSTILPTVVIRHLERSSRAIEHGHNRRPIFLHRVRTVHRDVQASGEALVTLNRDFTQATHHPTLPRGVSSS